MIVDAYLVNLALLVVLITAGIYSRSREKPQAAGPSDSAELDTEASKEGSNGGDSTSDVRFRAFRNRFLRVYVLAVAADWLQVCIQPHFPPPRQSY